MSPADSRDERIPVSGDAVELLQQIPAAHIHTHTHKHNNKHCTVKQSSFCLVQSVLTHGSGALTERMKEEVQAVEFMLE